MSEDIQMDLEPAHGPANPNVAAQTTNEPAVGQQEEKAYFSWQTSAPFTVPTQIPGTSQMSELSGAQFGAAPFIPPAVVASAQIVQAQSDMDEANESQEYISAKMHIRRPGRDNWSYIGRVLIFQELTHKAPTVVIRLQSTNKVVATFSEHSSISVDKRGNFIVVASVEPIGVISYSFHAQTGNDAIKLLASIELAAYKLGSITGTENRAQSKLRRRIEKTIKEDRRRRHKRRKDDDALVAMLGNANLGSTTVQ